MDSSVDSSIGINGILPIRKENCNTSSVSKPIFDVVQDETPAIFSKTLRESLDISMGVLSQELMGFETINNLDKSSDPFWYAIHKRSEFKFNRDYYDFKALNLQMDILKEGDTILSFSPMPIQYFEEFKAKLILVFIGTELEDEHSIGTPDVIFYEQLARNLDTIRVWNNLEYSLLSERWDEFEKLHIDNDNKNLLESLPVDLIFTVESVIGRGIRDNGERFGRYDHEFLETAIHSLNYLKENGTIIVKANSLGSRYIADLIYLYKYLFNEVCVCKTSTSNQISNDHYIIAKGFKKKHHIQILVSLEDLLNTAFLNLEDNEDFTLFSFIKNTIDDINFYEWLKNINNKIILHLHINILALKLSIDNSTEGYEFGRPYYLYDYVSYRESLGFIGRQTLSSLPKAEYSDETIIETVTQLEDPDIVLKEDNQLGVNFIKFIVLKRIVSNLSDKIISSPGSKQNLTQGCTPIYIEKEKHIYSKNIRKWLGLLLALGDLDKLFNEDNQLEVISSRNWSIFDIFNDISLTKNMIPDMIPNTIVDEFRNGKVLFQNLSNNPKFLINAIKLFASQNNNLRFRLFYSFNGFLNPIVYEENSEVIGEYEIFNFMFPEERKQVTDVYQLSKLMDNNSFINRIVENVCLPVLFSGYANNSNVKDMYFTYKPEIEAFASTANHFAPIWCSPYESDKKFGSSGNFFGEFSNPNNSVFDESKLMIAFPPSHIDIIKMTLNKCSKIIKYNDSRDFAIIIVYQNNSRIEEAIEFTLNLNNVKHTSTIHLNNVYQPFNGIIYKHANLKACLIKTSKSEFKLHSDIL